MLRLKSFFALFVIIAATSAGALAQENFNVSGHWAGTATWLGNPILLEYQLTQKGLLVEGFVYTKSTNGKDSTKATLAGTISGNEIMLRGTDFLYRKGGGCLSIAELEFSEDGKRLIGIWKGDFSLSTCPAGFRGKVEVARVAEYIPAQVAMKSVGTQEVHEDDFEGTALVNELSDRAYYALVIGIDDYKDDEIQSLDNPVADATALSEILSKYYTFEKGNVTLLTNPTRSQIIESFDALSMKIQERDQLLIFYAGHGIWDERLNQGFWLPSDASLNTKAQWLSNSTIRDYIGGINSKHTLLITDACFSGSIFKERAVFTESRAMLQMYKLPSRKAMTSGALKTVPDKSVFITYLNKGLMTNDRPLISAEELFRSFKTAVINNSANGQVPQYGPIGQVGDEGGDFIFLKR
ncbi:MAG: caspase family protein [Cyclobacteriaceae bacterium]